MSTEPRTATAWAPMAIPVFRILWCAQMASNIGTWMQTVGAQWMLVHQPDATALTSAVQAASLLPVLFVSLPAGVLADVLDRRRILIVLSLLMTALAGALAALTRAGLTTPAVLLALTFLLGCGQAVVNPAWQAIQPELVPRELIPAAAALNSLNVNIARAVGPALAGLLIAASGPFAVFSVNAASFAVITLAVLAWHRPPGDRTTTEHLLPALRSGTRYVRNAPGVRRILLRSALFVVPASALWALLPVTASRTLHLGAGGYGLLLAALGAGAVAGALLLRPLRTRATDTFLLAGATLVFAAGTAACALTHSAALAAVVLVPTGAAWLVNLSSFNTALQLLLPAWVRARGLALYLVVFMGGQGIGALFWGLAAGAAGLTTALLASVALLATGTATLPLWPMHSHPAGLDRTITSTWPEPALDLDPDPDDGPVLVEVTYTVTPENAEAFLAAMRPVGVSRRRTGAERWTMFRDAAQPDHYIEVFQVPSWAEHLRQHNSRTTATDTDFIGAATALTAQPPGVRHLLPPAPATPAGRDDGPRATPVAQA
ncbi:MFS transporter [Streptacidiphilus sp. PB12-B1b]|uniref:MFS transporter n=1 Tax=Streptacidiphilus sp. PB12-B1b TaxID=2705012 RepID=UPI001CDB92AB|nr:MFS transporter [Streptacidiphilus sp. PB12-B1b]